MKKGKRLKHKLLQMQIMEINQQIQTQVIMVTTRRQEINHQEIHHQEEIVQQQIQEDISYQYQLNMH